MYGAPTEEARNPFQTGIRRRNGQGVLTELHIFSINVAYTFQPLKILNWIV